MKQYYAWIVSLMLLLCLEFVLPIDEMEIYALCFGIVGWGIVLCSLLEIRRAMNGERS